MDSDFSSHTRTMAMQVAFDRCVPREKKLRVRLSVNRRNMQLPRARVANNDDRESTLASDVFRYVVGFPDAKGSPSIGSKSNYHIRIRHRIGRANGSAHFLCVLKLLPT